VNKPGAAASPRYHRFLGYAGLAPFLACTGTLLLSGDPFLRSAALEALVYYAAVVASFIGAVHWGVWLARYPQARSAHLMWGVLPALASWLLLLLTPTWALTGFIGLFLLMAVVDLRLLPVAYAGYPSLRRNLSLGVLFCLLGATPYAVSMQG